MIRKLLSVALVCPAFFSTYAATVPATVNFNSPQYISTNFQHLTGLAIADFNGDGKPDIAITDDYAQNIVVYLNDGTGQFGSPIVTTLAIPNIGGLGAIVAGDVNEDGRMDLVVGPVAGNQVDVVLLGKGDGTFTQGQFVTGSYGFFHAALVDLDGDGHLDFISGQNGDVYGALGDGHGNFSQISLTIPGNTSNPFFDLTVGDFNGDKIPDFVTLGYNTGGLFFFAGGPGGQFSPAVISYPDVASPFSITSADFNGDGKPDIVIGSADVATLSYGNGDGTFQIDGAQQIVLPLAYDPAVTSFGTTPVVASTDMNADGTIDIVAADDTYNKLSVLLNDDSGKFGQNVPDFQADLAPGVGELRLVDMNGDGLPDIIITNYKTQQVAIFLSVIPKLMPTLSVKSDAQQALVGNTVNVTVQLKGSGAHNPTGTIALASGTTSYGQQTLDTTGQASFTLSKLSAGQYPLTATYSGDQYYSGTSNNPALTQSITDFQLSLSSSTQSVPVGENATYDVNLTPEFGFTGAVTLICSGLPTGFSCASASGMLSGQKSIVPLVVTAPTTAVALVERKTMQPGGRILLALVGLFGFGTSFRKRRRILILPVLALSLTAGLFVGCSSNSSPLKTPAYTGTSTFTITATTTQGSVTVPHQVAATLTVQ